MKPAPLPTLKVQSLYGSSRLGSNISKREMIGATVPTSNFEHLLGYQLYEGFNHLGNVLTTFSDIKIPRESTTAGITGYYNTDVRSMSDYYPGGMQMPGRKYTSGSSYRYGFNGKENDHEVKGEGNQQDYGFRIYDPRLGRFLSVDPLTKSYPWYTPYQFAGNTPIQAIDLDGLEEYIVTVRTFLPYKAVLSPINKYNANSGNSRTYPQYKNVDAHGGFKTEQKFNIDFNNNKATYNPSPVPSTKERNLFTGIETSYENAGLGDKGSNAGISGDKGSIDAVIDADNPAVLFSPSINYDLDINVNKDGSYDVKGNWDGFPAIEVFLENKETGKTDLIYFNNTKDAGQTNQPAEINKLFPVYGDETINKSGNLGDSPQQDKDEPKK